MLRVAILIYKAVLISSLFVVFTLILTQTVRAACNPVGQDSDGNSIYECGDPLHPAQQCPGNQHCNAKCCVNGPPSSCADWSNWSACNGSFCQSRTCLDGPLTNQVRSCGGGVCGETGGGGAGGNGGACILSTGQACDCCGPGNLSTRSWCVDNLPNAQGGRSSQCPGYQCTTPVITSVNRNSPTSLTVNWTPGQSQLTNDRQTDGGGYKTQYVYVGTDPTNVASDCSSSASFCFKSAPLSGTDSTYSTGNILSPGTVYYVKVEASGDVNQGGWCSNGPVSDTELYLSSCSFSQSSFSLLAGYSTTLSSTVQDSGEVDNVTFSSDDASIASVSPTSDDSYVYETEATGVNPGTTTINSSAIINGATACTANLNVTVSPPGPWWQVIDGDVYANGNLVSEMPAGNSFDLDGPGGFPGIPTYSGSADFSAGNYTPTVSSTNWTANSALNLTKTYNTAYFLNQIPTDVVINPVPNSSVDGTFFESGGTASFGYYWYEYDGSVTGLDLTITGNTNLADRKVILLVKSANLNLQGNINLTDGVGFLFATVGKTESGNKGNIVIDPGVGGGATPNLEGIFLADGQVQTGTGGTQSDQPLHIRGSIGGYDGISLQRDLGPGTNPTNPSEVFEYAPDQELLFPPKLDLKPLWWKEVAP